MHLGKKNDNLYNKNSDYYEMKKTWMFLFSLIMGGILSASPVHPEQARQVAFQFCRLIDSKSTLQDPSELMDVSSTTPFTTFYTFQLGEKGFVLVSADDCVVPILGYSFENPLQVENMPAQLTAWLRSYEDQILYLRDKGVTPADAVSIQWKSLENGIRPAAALPSSVSPLLSTTWSQNPNYNKFCPGSGTGADRAVTGCVATATAQVMKYWNHPATGRSSHSYNDDQYGYQSADFGNTTYQWSNMPNSLSGASSTTQIDAVALLMFHVGVAVEMNYGTESAGGSSAPMMSFGQVSVASAEHALVNYFRYQPSLHSVVKSDYTDAQWSSMLRADLDAGHPIIYQGDDFDGGHCFVCDGYDNNGRFHFNWGWGGYMDGFYAIGALNLSGGGTGSTSSYTFNLNNGALLGIVPQTSSAANTTITASSNSGSYGSVFGAGSYTNFVDTVSLLASANTGYRFEQWSDGYKYNPRRFLATGGTNNFQAVFVPIAGDTITYCAGHELERLSLGRPSSWGMRIPSSSLVAGTSLSKVRVFTPATGSYTITIYKGTTLPTTQLLSQSFTSSAADTWITVTLSSPVSVDATQSLFVTVSSSVDFPMTTTYFSGNADGAWIKYENSWMQLSGSGYWITWMIDAVFSSSTPSEVSIDDMSEVSSYRIWADRRNIVVTGAAGQEVSVFDVLGRRVARETTASEPQRIAVTQPGVYFILVDGTPARRVVVL